MDITALQNLILSLDAVAIKMRDTGVEMKAFKDEHPELFTHGCEMLGAADMVEEWIAGIVNEIDEYEISSSNQCDGCRQKLRVVDGLHRTKDDQPFMACTSHLYS